MATLLSLAARLQSAYLVSGSIMTIKGVAAGAANITVTDSLGTV